jgi:uncharacterized protein (DUF58 family)
MSVFAPSTRPARVVRLTRRGGALLAVSIVSFGCAYLFVADELLILGCFTGAPPLLALWFVRSRRPRVSAKRIVSPRVLTAGRPGTVRAEVTNLTNTPLLQAKWRDLLAWSPGSTPIAPLPPLGRGPSERGVARLRYELTPPRRGIVEIGPIVVETTDPFGLARAEFTVGGAQKVVVTPQAVPLNRHSLGLAADSGSARLFQRRAIAGDDDLMTREYRPGDALRRVHWRASAHHGELMVRDEEQRSHAEALIVLETRRSGYRDVTRYPVPDRPDSESFEWALRMTSSLCQHLAREGFLVRLVETGAEQLAPVTRAEAFQESLANIRLTYSSTLEGALLPCAPRSDAALGPMFVILGDPDADLLHRLAEHRAAFGRAVAFRVVPDRSAGADEASATEFLTASGFRCTSVVSQADVAQVWDAINKDEIHVS